MAQGVRVERAVDVRAFAGAPDHLPHRLARQASAAQIEEHGAHLLLALRPGRKGRTAVAQIPLKCAPRVVPERHKPLFAALAHEPHHAFVEIDVVEIHPHSLAHTATRGVHELQQCAVAQSHGVLRVGGLRGL